MHQNFFNSATAVYCLMLAITNIFFTLGCSKICILPSVLTVKKGKRAVENGLLNAIGLGRKSFLYIPKNLNPSIFFTFSIL